MKRDIEEAIDRVQMDEDIWAIVRWLLAKLGIGRKQTMQDYKVVDMSRVAGRSLHGAATLATLRTLTMAERKVVEVIPTFRSGKRPVIILRRNIRVSASDSLADKVVNFLIKMGGRVISG